MNFDQVLELVKTVSDSELTGFQYEEGNQKIVMQVGGSFLAGGIVQESAGEPVNLGDVRIAKSVTTGTASVNAAQVQSSQPAVKAPAGNLVESPLVGRFYVAPSEEAEAFVKVGDTVKKGQTLAIVEAMKLMNEIESEFDGVVTEVLAQNGQGVEYGQPLFRIS